ncbi:unnamed protein product, partial [Rotaria socialis]
RGGGGGGGTYHRSGCHC